jgi:hypothetical protein
MSTMHQAVTDEIRDLASMYSLGLLETPDSGMFERHVEECGVCREEVRAFRESAGQLALALPESRPEPRVRGELLRRTAPQSWLVRANDGAWQATPFAGVEVKQLFVDTGTGNVTSLVRLEAGAYYPRHRHAAHEHCYVVEGDVVFSDHVLRTGDYEVNAPGTDLSHVTSQGGFVLFIINKVGDIVFLQ